MTENETPQSVAEQLNQAEEELRAAQARVDALRAQQAQSCVPPQGQYQGQPYGQQVPPPYQQPFTPSMGAHPGYWPNQQPFTPSYSGVHPTGVPVGCVSKDHIAAGLLAIFLGSLGVHKFYLGYNTAGFIMLAVTVIGGLITLGLATFAMGVVSFIEGILYLTKSQAEFERTYLMQERQWF